MILVDSNVIIDVINNDPDWKDWSLNQIAHFAARTRVMVDEIVLAEVAPSMGSLTVFYRETGKLGIDFESISDEAAFAAGQAFLGYRMSRRIEGKAILADFLIGGHAQSLGATILTRDPRFYRAYFPEVPLIAPDKAET
jgi:predicted nucleic acid-binding protein